MTQAAVAPAEATPGFAESRPDPWSMVGDLAVAAVLLYWATYLTWGVGGREPHRLTWFSLLIGVALLAVRPWRTLSQPCLVLATGLGVAAIGVLATAPTGWAGRHDAASYVAAGQLFLLVAAWARDTLRRTWLLVWIVFAGGAQMASGWLAWWGGGSSDADFHGTFYWHNQTGIFLAIAALAAFGLVITGERPWALLGWVVGPLAAAGVVFTTSRGSMLTLGIGGVLLLIWSLARPGGYGGTLRLLAGAGAGALTSVVLTGPPFFVERASPVAGTAVRAVEQPVTGNGELRLLFWERALLVFQEWPLSGAGFHSFGQASARVTEIEAGTKTNLVHNGFLQAAADGGLLLFLPLAAITLALLVLAARGIGVAVRSSDAPRVIGAVLLVAVVLHSGMDFDWTYPALLSLAAIVAALVVASGPASDRVAGSRLRWVLAVACPALLIFAAVAAWPGGLDLTASMDGAR